jgi:hypothetical protein
LTTLISPMVTTRPIEMMHSKSPYDTP